VPAADMIAKLPDWCCDWADLGSESNDFGGSPDADGVTQLPRGFLGGLGIQLRAGTFLGVSRQSRGWCRFYPTWTVISPRFCHDLTDRSLSGDGSSRTRPLAARPAPHQAE
jgi:hypothetical protein